MVNTKCTIDIATSVKKTIYHCLLFVLLSNQTAKVACTGNLQEWILYSHCLHCSIRNTFREIICKSNRFKNTFFPDAIASWNIFIKHFDNCPSFQILKEHINTCLRPMTKSIFGKDDPVGLRYLIQLRVSLSPLRSHK